MDRSQRGSRGALLESGDRPSRRGSLCRRQSRERRPINYFRVESVDEFSAKVKALGGEIVVPKSLVPSLGYFAIARDPEGNSFGLWEENPGVILVEYTESG